MVLINVILLLLPFILHRILPGRQERWQNRIREVLFYLLFAFVTLLAIWYVHGWWWVVRSFDGWRWVACAWWGIWLLAYLFILPDVLKLLSKMFYRSAWNRKTLIRLGAAILFVVILAGGLYFLAVYLVFLLL
jgi:amino acid permease